jgi:hypothetical protein
MKRQYVENATLYRWSVLVLILSVPFLNWLFIDWNSVSSLGSGNGSREVIFVISCAIFPVIFGGTFFENIASKYKGMSYFSLPVSVPERLTAAFSYTMILFPAACFTLFSVCDAFSIWLYNTKFDTDYVSFVTYLDFELVYLIVTMISMFVLGSFMFGKISIVKTGAVLAILFGLFQGLIKLIYPLIIRDEIKNVEFDSLMFKSEAGIWEWVQVETFFSHSWYFIAPLCWIVLYFKLKEREV